MAEEIIIEQEYIDAAKKQIEADPRLQPCPMCMHYDPEKNWCRFFQVKKMSYNYGLNCFLTNEIALKALLIKERKRANTVQAKINEKLDVMMCMINGANMILADIRDIYEDEYSRLDIKGKDDDKIYQKTTRNLDRLKKCYGNMKKSMQDIENDFNRYIEYYHMQVFGDAKGAYSPEYDKSQYNSGFCTYMFFGMHNKTFENRDNSLKLAKFVDELEGGRNVLETEDLKRYLIKI